MRNLVLVDCEGGQYAGPGMLSEFGAVLFDVPPFEKAFHGRIALDRGATLPIAQVMSDFEDWLNTHTKGRPIFVSDNPAYDWQHINWAFWVTLGRNPFGHSARRISDFYAGLMRDFSKTQQWKRWRQTPHDHNPVNDARGNAEALWKMLEEARAGLCR